MDLLKQRRESAILHDLGGKKNPGHLPAIKTPNEGVTLRCWGILQEDGKEVLERRNLPDHFLEGGTLPKKKLLSNAEGEKFIGKKEALKKGKKAGRTEGPAALRKQEKNFGLGGLLKKFTNAGLLLLGTFRELEIRKEREKSLHRLNLQKPIPEKKKYYGGKLKCGIRGEHCSPKRHPLGLRSAPDERQKGQSLKRDKTPPANYKKKRPKEKKSSVQKGQSRLEKESRERV